MGKRKTDQPSFWDDKQVPKELWNWPVFSLQKGGRQHEGSRQQDQAGEEEILHGYLRSMATELACSRQACDNQ
jgi:hypothetical protein